MIELLLLERLIHNEADRQDFTITIPRCLEPLLSIELPAACFIVETASFRFAGFDILVKD